MLCTVSARLSTFFIATSWYPVWRFTVDFSYAWVLPTSFPPHIRQNVIFVAFHDTYNFPVCTAAPFVHLQPQHIYFLSACSDVCQLPPVFILPHDVLLSSFVVSDQIDDANF